MIANEPLLIPHLLNLGLLRHVYLIQLVPTRFDGTLGSYYTYQYTYSNHTEKVDVKSSHWHLPGTYCT